MASRVPSLTGVRAVAALSVCLTHAAFWTGRYTDDYGGRLFARFEVGVAIFFVLSGFLLFSPWVRAAQRGSGRTADAGEGSTTLPIGRYFWHRARRVLPVYWITVIGVYLLYAIAPPAGEVSPTGTGWSGFWRNMTLTQVYGLGHLHSGLTQMWSLAAEAVFYLVLPLIAWIVVVGVARFGGRAGGWRPDLIIAALVPLLLISPVWSVIVAGSAGVDPTARLWAPAFFGWFVGGMLLAACAPVIRRWNATTWVLTAVVAFVVAGGALAGEPTITPTTASATIVKHVLYLVIAVGVVGPLTGADQSSWWARLCGSRPMVFVGEISYELFCVHVVVLEVVMAVLGYRVFTGNVVIAFVLTAAVSVVLAWALHRVTSPLWRARAPGTVGSRR
ncbi:acyltransferase family protein [Gordonia sp. DT30]|uniref:acyltransferase family protein n=1 Tax=Gordonia sp. DT30 TaxID=3416546 RepID=UPI003CF774B0